MSDLYAFLGAQQNGQQLEQQDRNNQYRQRQEQRVNRLDQEHSSNAALENIMKVLALGSTPVNPDRMVQQMLGQSEQQQAANAGVLGLTEIQRQADPSRTVPLSMPGGGQQLYEIPNADQVFQRMLGQKSQVNRVDMQHQAEVDALHNNGMLNRQNRHGEYMLNARQQVENAQRQFFGSELPLEVARFVNAKPGQKFLPEEVNHHILNFKNYRDASQPKPGPTHWETNDQGFTTAMTMDASGNPVAKPVGKYGKSKTHPAGENGRLTTEQAVKIAVNRAKAGNTTGNYREAIRNVQEHFQNDPLFNQPNVRALAIAALQAEAGKKESHEQEGQYDPGKKAPAPATAQSGAPAATGGKMTAEQYLQSLKK